MVIGISLSLNNLDGHMLSDLAELRDLEVLEFGSNRLFGSIPHEIVKLKKLEILNVLKNCLKGM